MPRSRRRGRSKKADVLTDGEYWALMLGDPDDPMDTAFRSLEEREEKWRLHRGWIFEEWSNAGHRPWAFWKYDAPGPRLTVLRKFRDYTGRVIYERPDLETQEEYLRRWGLLADWEEKELRRARAIRERNWTEAGEQVAEVKTKDESQEGDGDPDGLPVLGTETRPTRHLSLCKPAPASGSVVSEP